MEEEEEHGWICFFFSVLKTQLVVKVKRTKLDIYTFEMHQKCPHFISVHFFFGKISQIKS